MKKILTFILLFVSLFTVLAVATTPQAEAATTVIYLKPNSNWTQSNAWFCARVWNSSGDKWYEMKDTNGDGYYEASIDTATYPNVIFCRMNSGNKTSKDWNNVWNQTKDLTFSSSNNCYTVSAGAWSKGSGSWSSYTPKAPELSLVGTLPLAEWKPENENYLMTKKDGIYSITVELNEGETKFKIARDKGWDSPYGYGITVNGITTSGDTDGNIVTTLHAGTYHFEFNPATSTLNVSVVSYKDVASVLKECIATYYNKGSYLRTTDVNLDEKKVGDDLITHFHNPQSGKNIYTQRETYFCGSYLYFNETGTGFGSNGNKLTSFNWNNLSKEQKDALATQSGDALENTFVTLYDFAQLNAVSNDVTGSLANGWTYAGGVYTSNDVSVKAAALAFTAPGVINMENFIDCTHVTINVDTNGNLVITLWCSATEIGVNGQPETGKLKNDTVVSGDFAVFSQAVIAKPVTE